MGYKHFDMTDLIDKALNEGNLRSARRVISDICPSDRTFTTGEFECFGVCTKNKTYTGFRNI